MATTEKAIVELVLKLTGESKGFDAVKESLKGLGEALKDQSQSVATSVGNSISELETIRVNLNAIKKDLETSGSIIDPKLIEDLATVNKVIEQLTASFNKLPFKQKFEEARKGVSNLIIDLGGETAKQALTFKNLRNSLDYLGKVPRGAGELEEWLKRLNSFIHQLGSQYIQLSPTAFRFGEDFIKGLRESISSSSIKTVFEQAFAGNTKLLEPLRKALADDSVFLTQFTKYVETDFNNSFNTIKTGAVNVVDSLISLGQKTRITSLGLQELQTGFNTTVETISNAANRFNNFAAVQDILASRFGITSTKLTEVNSNFIQYGETANQVSDILKQVYNTLGTMSPALPNLQPQLTAFEEFNNLIVKINKGVAELKGAQEKLTLAKPEDIKRQENIVSDLVNTLARYQSELKMVDPSKFEGVASVLNLQDQQINRVIIDLEKLNKTAPVELQAAIGGLISGLASADAATIQLLNDFNNFRANETSAASSIEKALLAATGDLGGRLKVQIDDTARYAEEQLKDIRIPPLEFKTLGLGASDNISKMFQQITGLVNGVQNRWAVFSDYLKNKGVPLNAISALETSIRILSPVLAHVKGNVSDFGKAFNSNSTEARGNLVALDTVLRVLAENVVGSTSAFEGPRQAVKQLRDELDLIAGAKDIVSSITERVAKLGTGVRTSAVDVERLGTSLASFPTKVGPDNKEFASTVKVVNALNDGLQNVETSLESLQKIDIKGNIFTGQLGLEITALLAHVLELREKLSTRVQAPLADIKTKYIDERLSTSSKEFNSFQVAVKKSMDGVASSFLQLEDKGQVFKAVEKSFLRMSQALSDPTKIEQALKRLATVVSGYQKRLSLNYNIIPSGKTKEATDELKGLITVINEYITAQLAASRLKLADQMKLKPTDRDTTLVADLKKQNVAYEGLLVTLNGLSAGLEASQRSFDNHKTFLELNKKATEDNIDVVKALKVAYSEAKGTTDQFNINNVLTSFNALSTGTIKSVSALDKIIQKLEEMKRAGYDIPKNEVFKADVSGAQVAFKSIDEYIDHLKSLKKESTDFIEGQSKIIAPLEKIKKAFDDLQGAQGISSGSAIKGMEEATNLFSNALVKAIDQFHDLTKGAKDFSTLQMGYARHKEELAGLAVSIESVIVALKQMPAGSMVSFGEGTFGATALVDKLTMVSRAIAEQATAISVALQAGGKSINDFLLTGSQGSRYQLIDKQITDLSTRIAAAVGRIQDLGVAGKPIDIAEVEQLKTLIAELVKERSAIMAEIKSGIERMQGGFGSAEALLTKDELGPLKVEVDTAIGLFNKLTATVEKATVSINGMTVSTGDIGKMVTPVLQFNEAVSNLDTQLARSTQPATTFDLAIQGMVATLKGVETQLGITTHAYDSFDKVQLKSMSGDLTIRLNELAKTYAEVTRSIVAMETATASNKGIGVSSTELDAAKAKAEALKKQMEELARAIGTMQRVIREKPEGTDILSTFGDNVASSVDKVKGAGALLSKFMSHVFESIIKNNMALHGMGTEEEQVANKTRLLAAAIQEMETKLVTSLRSMDMMAMGLQMLGQAMVEPFKKAVESFSKFSDTMAFIQGATGATTAEMEDLAKTAMIVGTTTRVSAQDAAEGLKELALAGYDAGQSLAVLPTVVRLAQAAEMQLGATTEIVVNIMNSQRIGAEGIAEAVDVLSVAANRTTATVTDMGTAFKYIGALAGSIGNEFTDTAGAVALLHNAGLRGCYDDQTEVMTRNGFKFFKELKYEDEILTLNRDSLALEWQKPKSIVQYDVSEDLIYIRSGAVDLAVTKEHNLFIETVTGTRKLLHASKFKDGKFFRTGIWHGNNPEFFEIPEITRDRGSYVEFINSVKIPTARWVEFLGWYFSEGSLHLDNHGNYRIRITQKSNNKDFDSLKTCLESLLPFKFKYDGLSFVCRSVQLFRLLEKYGVGTFNKKVPDYVKEYSPDLIQIFLESYRKGDGDSSFTLYTSNEQLAFDLQELGIKAGYGTSFNVCDRAGRITNFIEGDQTRLVIGTKPCYDISIATTHTHPFISKSEISRRKEAGLSSFQKTYVEERHYEGIVYCAEVPNHTMYVRRNGKGVFCGNSMAGTALRGTLQALLNPTKDEARVMGELSNRLGGVGLQIVDSQGKFVGFSKVIKQFEQAGMTTAEVLELFGQRAGPGMAALLQMGSKQLDTLVNDLENAEGATSQLSANMEATFGGSVQIMRNSLESFGEVIGHAIAGPLATLANMVANVAQKMVEFGAVFPGVTAVLSQLSGAVAVAFLAMGSLAMAWTMMLVPATQLFKFIGTITTVLLTATAALKGLTAATAGQILANQAFGASLLASTTATSKFGAALVILKTIVMGIGSALLKPWTPFGAAMTVLTLAIGAVVYAFTFMKRNLGTVNAEFDKNQQIITNNVTAFRVLRNQILDTANVISNLRLANKGLTTEQFINLPVFQQQKEQLLTQLTALKTRLNESELGKDVVVIENIDDLTGKLTGLTVISNKTWEVLGKVDVSMLSAVGGAEALAKGINSINKAMADSGKQKIKESVIDQLAENLSRSADNINEQFGRVGAVRQDALKQAEDNLSDLLIAHRSYVALEQQLAQEEISGNKKKYDELLRARGQFYVQIKERFSDDVTLQATNPDTFAKAMETQINSIAKSVIRLRGLEALSKQELTKIVTNFESFSKGKKVDLNLFKDYFIEAAKKSGKFGDETLAILIPQVEAIWQGLQKSADAGAENVDFGSSLEGMFRNLQRQTSSFSQLLDETVKELTEEQGQITQVLNKYQSSVDAFAKVRNDYATAAKATMDMGVAKAEQQLTSSMNNIVASAYSGYGKVAEASISWTNPASAATRTEANQFQVIQDTKVAIASASAGKMYNVFTTSLQKQINDLERESKVVENVFTIPLRLESYEVGSEIRKMVVGGKVASRQLFDYQITINKKLIEAQLYKEQVILDLQKTSINKQLEANQIYFDKIKNHQAEGTQRRLELDIEYVSKQKELNQKGLDYATASLDRIYAYHEQISNKIKSLKENEANFLSSLDEARRKLLAAGQTEAQQKTSQFQDIRNLFELARKGVAAGEYDKAIEAYKKIKDVADSIEFDPTKDNESVKRRLLSIYNEAEKGYKTASAGIKLAAEEELNSVESLGKAMQDNLRGFEAGVANFAGKLDVLVNSMESLKKDFLKMDFGKDQKINLDDTQAVASFVDLEKHYLLFKRMLEQPLEVEITPAKIDELRKLVDESLQINQKLAATKDAQQAIKPFEKQITETNVLLSLYSNLQEARDKFNESPVTSGELVVGQKITDMNTEDVKEINKTLQEREIILNSLAENYLALKQTVPDSVQVELAAVKKARLEFAEGKETSLGYTEVVKHAFEQNSSAAEDYAKRTNVAMSDAQTSMATTLSTVTPILTDVAKDLRDLNSQKNLDIRVRASASTNLDVLYESLKQLKQGLDEKQTSAALDLLILQMKGYKDSLQDAAKAGDQMAKDNIVALDSNIKKIEELKTQVNVTNAEKIESAEKANKEIENMANQQAVNEIKQKVTAVPSTDTAVKAAEINAEKANATAQDHPVVLSVVGDNNQAKQVTEKVINTAQQKASQKPTMIGIAADPATVQKFKDEADRIKKEVEQGVGITWGAKLPPVMVKPQVDKSKLNQGLNEVVAVVDKTAAKLPIEADTQQLEVAAKDVEALKYKLTTLIQANAQFKFFQGNKTTQEIMDLIRPLDLLISKKDQAGNIQFAVTDTSISQATSKLHELHGAATQVFGSLGNGSAAMSSYFEKAAWDLERLRAVAKGDPTIANLGALQQAEDAFLKLRLAMELVKNTSESPISIVPIGAEQQLELVNTQLTQFKEKLSSLSTQELGFVGYENSLRGLQTELATFQQQVAQGVNLDPAKINDFKQRFMELMSAAENKQIGIQFDPSGIENIKNILDSLSSALLNVPSLTVASDSSAVDTALQKVNQLLNLNGSTSTIDVIANIIRQESGGYQKGGLVNSISRFMAGGVAQVQHLATGGSLLFKRIINKVPGVGVGDKIPAMLEPGEYVIKRSIVNDLGIGFFNHLNSGLLQFKQLGGLMYNAPNILLKDLSPQLKASFGGFTTPALATQNSSVDINLSFGNKGFNIRKVPRESVGTLVEALRYLERGLK